MINEQIYLFRRKGFSDYSTCDRARYFELSHHKLFETMICYSGDLQQRLTAAEQRNAALTKALTTIRENSEDIGACECAADALADAAIKPTKSGASNV